MVTTSGSIRKMFQRIRRDSKPTITEPVTASLLAKHGIQPSTTHLEYAPTTNIQTEALVVMAPGEGFTLLPITLDEVRPDEVLVEMKASGICHTDLILQQGKLPLLEFPAILGHEGAGIIRAVGSGVLAKQSLQIGSHVLISFHACGECRQCRAGRPCFCHRHPEINHNAVRLSDRSSPASLGSGESVRSQYFGHSSFARMSVVPGDCVVPISVDRDNGCLDPIYAPLGCGFQTGAGTILNVLQPSAADSVVIFGLGSVGLTALMAAVSPYCGARAVLAVDIQDTKLALASELGATVTINSHVCPDVVQQIKKETHGGADFAIDCTGIIGVMETAVECLAPKGTAACVGVPPADRTMKLDPLTFLLENKSLVGVVEGGALPKEFIPRLIEMHRSGYFPIERLCKVYSASNFNKAITDLEEGRVIKPIICWD